MAQIGRAPGDANTVDAAVVIMLDHAALAYRAVMDVAGGPVGRPPDETAHAEYSAVGRVAYILHARERLLRLEARAHRCRQREAIVLATFQHTWVAAEQSQQAEDCSGRRHV